MGFLNPLGLYDYILRTELADFFIIEKWLRGTEIQ